MNASKEPPKLPEVKKNIRALLISAPRGLTVDDIEHDYHAVLGKPLPFKHFRCKTALEFLKTMPDVVCPSWSNGILILKGIADDSSKHIAKLVARQRVNSSKSRRIARAPICTRPLVVPDNFRRNIKELLSVYPNGILGSSLCQTYLRHYGEDINHTKLGFKSMSQFLNAIQDIVTIVKNPKGGYRVCAIKRTPPLVRKKPSLLSAPSSQLLPSHALLSKPQSQNIPPLRVPPSKVPSKIEPPKSGAYVIPSKCKPLTDLNSLESVKKDKDKQNVERVKDMLDSKSGVSESLKDELVSVLANRPNGVWAARLPFEFKTLVGKELNVLTVGFYSIIEMASALPDIFRIERPFPNGDWLLFLAAKSRKDKNITKVHLPENAIGKGVGYKRQDLPGEFDIELYVTHIRTPDCFWIQLLKYEREVTELQDNMREFYSSKESAKFMVDESLIKLGQVCVARFPVDREWYRALITAIPSPVLVEVFYVDYGNSSQVSKSDIRLMKKDFIELPSQAIKSKLANVVPKLTKWDPSAAHRMNELTANKPLIGLSGGKKDDVLHVYICDTTGKDDIYINDKLVEEGFAKLKQVNGRSTPPGLPPPDPSQKEINQQITLNSLQPIFPDYSIPLYTGLPYDFSLPLMNMPAPVEATLPQTQEESPPIIMDEEKPTEEELEFMREVCEELSDAINVVVKRLNLPSDKIIHVIKFEENAYVVRSEISALLWESDILRSMLRNVKKVVEKEIISKEDHEELFDELRRLKVGDFAESEEAKEYASLYHLSTIPGILETFHHPSPELVQTIKNEVAAYEQNPETYWTDEADNAEEGTDDSCQSEAEEEHDLEELRLAEQALQFARKRILRAMTNGDLTPGEDIVDEAADVERRLAHIRDLITMAEAKEAAKDKEGSQESQVTQEEKVDSKGDGDGLSEALPSQSEEPPAKPIGVTRPEVRQPSTTTQNLVVSTAQYPNIPRSTSDYPSLLNLNITTATSRNSNIPTSIPQNPNIPTSTPQYPNIPTSTSHYPNIPTSIPQNLNTPTSIPQYPNIPTNTHQYPNKPTTTSQNPNLFKTPYPSNSSVGTKTFRSKVAPIIAPGGNEVYLGSSVDNQPRCKNFVESKQTMEKVFTTKPQPENSVNSKKRTRILSQGPPHYVTLPHLNQPIGGLPPFMHGGPMTSLPMQHPFSPPPNVHFQGFLGPLHPLAPPPFPDLMYLNGPLSSPNLVNPSQLLYQYGSPFPNPRHGSR